MSVELKTVKSRSDLRKFIDFPNILYKDCENYVPALRGDEFSTFNRKKNGAYDFCESECYLAYKDGKLAGRVAAIINNQANENWNQKVVRFGWLDFIDDIEVLKTMLDKVAEWGKARGCTEIKGPLGFTDMDKEGLLVEGYENLSPFTCLYNYPYYEKLLSELGFEKSVDWTQKIIYLEKVDFELGRSADIISRRYGVHLVYPKSTKELGEQYGMAIFHMYNETFAPLYEFAPINDRQIEAYLKTYIAILDPRYVAVCLNDKDEPVGFAFCVPSLSKAVKKCGGKLFPFGWIPMLRALKKNDTLEALMIGVLPEYQGKGVTPLLFNYIYESCKKSGIKYMLLNPQLEDNYKVQSIFEQFEHKLYMRRRAFKKAI